MFGGRLAIALAVAAAALSGVGGGFASSPYAEKAVAPPVSVKAVRGARRHKLALPEEAPRYRRSRNPRTPRRLRANRLHISRRARRRHRRSR